MITGGQIRAARAFVRMSAQNLADRCELSYAAIQRAERVDDIPNMQTKNLAAIRTALESAGVIFVAENGDGPGVRLRKGTP